MIILCEIILCENVILNNNKMDMILNTTTYKISYIK